MAARGVLSSAHLDPASRVRYVQKIALAGVSDPYDIPSNLFVAIEKHARFDDKALPHLTYMDIANYLVFSCSTRNDFVNDIVNDARADAIFATLKAIVDDEKSTISSTISLRVAWPLHERQHEGIQKS